MSARAQSILDQIKALPQNEQIEVCEEVATLRSRQQAWEGQKAKLRAMQSRNADSGLLKQLLEDRTRERAGG